MIQLLLIQRTPMLCELFSSVLREEQDIEVAGYTHNEKDAQSYIRKKLCNTILLDVELLNNDVLQFVRSLRQNNPDIKIITSGLVRSNTLILRCIEEGVHGYILEDDSLAVMVNKIRGVHESEFVVSPPVASALIERVAELKQRTRTLNSLDLDFAANLLSELTPREQEVLNLVEQGYSNQQIAAKLIIEKGTVKNHVHNILGKLDVHSRDQAALLVRQLRIENQKNEPISNKVKAMPIFPYPKTSHGVELVN